MSGSRLYKSYTKWGGKRNPFLLPQRKKIKTVIEKVYSSLSFENMLYMMKHDRSILSDVKWRYQCIQSLIYLLWKMRGPFLRLFCFKEQSLVLDKTEWNDELFCKHPCSRCTNMQTLMDCLGGGETQAPQSWG